MVGRPTRSAIPEQTRFLRLRRRRRLSVLSLGVGAALLAVALVAVYVTVSRPSPGTPAAQDSQSAPVDGVPPTPLPGGSSVSGSPSASASASASAGKSPAKPGGPGAPPVLNRTCSDAPSACGYPDASNTGWRHTGVKLKTVVADPYYIDKPGQVVDGLDIHGCVYVRAKNVTIKRSKITCDNQPMVKNFEPDGHGGLTDIGAGLLIEDTEFDGMSSPTAMGVAFNNFTVLRSDFHNLAAALKLGNGVRVEDNYVHNISYTSTSHNGGFPSDGGTGITVRHNTVMMNSQNGYAIAIYNWIPAGSVVADVVVDNNLLAGGNYILYCGAPGHPAPNLRVTNNRFSAQLFAKGGYYGPAANCDQGITAWTNNYWDANRAPLSP
jgi:hypothetical protein